MTNPETIVPVSTPTDSSATWRGGAVLALFLLGVPLYVALFLLFCALAVRAAQFLGALIGF